MFPLRIENTRAEGDIVMGRQEWGQGGETQDTHVSSCPPPILDITHLLSLSRSRSRVTWATQPVRPSIYLNIKHIELLHSTSEYVMDNLGPEKHKKIVFEV